MIIKCVHAPGFREFLELSNGALSCQLRVAAVIPIVGTQHRDLKPYPLDGGVEVRPEPDNAHDRHALAVWHRGRHIGYVGRDKQHWISGPDKDCSVRFKQNADWNSGPKLISTNDSWTLYVLRD